MRPSSRVAPAPLVGMEGGGGGWGGGASPLSVNGSGGVEGAVEARRRTMGMRTTIGMRTTMGMRMTARTTRRRRTSKPLDVHKGLLEMPLKCLRELAITDSHKEGVP